MAMAVVFAAFLQACSPGPDVASSAATLTHVSAQEDEHLFLLKNGADSILRIPGELGGGNVLRLMPYAAQLECIDAENESWASSPPAIGSYNEKRIAEMSASSTATFQLKLQRQTYQRESPCRLVVTTVEGPPLISSEFVVKGLADESPLEIEGL